MTTFIQNLGVVEKTKKVEPLEEDHDYDEPQGLEERTVRKFFIT